MKNNISSAAVINCYKLERRDSISVAPKKTKQNKIRKCNSYSLHLYF